MKSKSFVLFLSILLLFLLIGTESSSSSLTGGIRNFKFRKKDPNISNPNKKMELRRYHDGKGRKIGEAIHFKIYTCKSNYKKLLEHKL